MAGSAAAVLGARFRAMGAMLAAPPESFYVTAMQGSLEEGEITRALVWGRRLHLGERVVVDDE
jgi:hypothetical protein